MRALNPISGKMQNIHFEPDLFRSEGVTAIPITEGWDRDEWHRYFIHGSAPFNSRFFKRKYLRMCYEDVELSEAERFLDRSRRRTLEQCELEKAFGIDLL